MPDPVFYLRGFPTSPIANPMGSPQLLEDLREVVLLQADTAAKIGEAVMASRGFLDGASLRSLVKQFLPNDSSAASVSRVLRNLDEGAAKSLIKALAEIGEDDDPAFSPAELDKLGKNLGVLIRNAPSLIKQKKAELLAEIIPNQVETIDLISDLRPVFDEERKHVEGLIPYIVLQIVITGQDGLPVLQQSCLSRRHLDELSKKIEMAKAKLASLEQFAKEHATDGMPSTGLTRVVKKGSDDE